MPTSANSNTGRGERGVGNEPAVNQRCFPLGISSSKMGVGESGQARVQGCPQNGDE
ncbi:hypothetical protein B9Z19DRAFT_770172 [Tuber borchii]|uniref:Uncharacterized protein n=1 Tax=Tuber borchii TaxID=42251 RepID=A0A2T6ZWX9_TUBBO|nr:hypothetical protein B9Z19DRAFT_770172 [Tuber borchii]